MSRKKNSAASVTKKWPFPVKTLFTVLSIARQPVQSIFQKLAYFLTKCFFHKSCVEIQFEKKTKNWLYK